MRVYDLINTYENANLDLIKRYCNQFLNESVGLPIFKALPNVYENFQKVKVRKRKPTNTFSATFNGAFKDELNDLRERAVFTNGVVGELEENAEPFYIFPINGYKFLYSKEVKDSTESYRQVFESIFDNLGKESGQAVFADMLRFTYLSENLPLGIESGAEIILYKIPYYYAIRESSIDSYEELLTMLT